MLCCAVLSCCRHAGGPLKSVVSAIVGSPTLLWMAAVLEQLMENSVVLAREADQHEDLGGTNDSKVGIRVQNKPVTKPGQAASSLLTTIASCGEPHPPTCFHNTQRRQQTAHGEEC